MQVSVIAAYISIVSQHVNRKKWPKPDAYLHILAPQLSAVIFRFPNTYNYPSIFTQIPKKLASNQQVVEPRLPLVAPRFASVGGGYDSLLSAPMRPGGGGTLMGRLGPHRRCSSVTCSSTASSYLERRGSAMVMPCLPPPPSFPRHAAYYEPWDLYHPIDIQVYLYTRDKYLNKLVGQYSILLKISLIGLVIGISLQNKNRLWFGQNVLPSYERFFVEG